MHAFDGIDTKLTKAMHDLNELSRQFAWFEREKFYTITAQVDHDQGMKQFVFHPTIEILPFWPVKIGTILYTSGRRSITLFTS